MISISKKSLLGTQKDYFCVVDTEINTVVDIFRDKNKAKELSTRLNLEFANFYEVRQLDACIV